MTMWALLPIKTFSSAKQRLAGWLTAAERRDFSRAMAEDVMATLAAHGGIAGVTVCSADPAVEALARAYACDFLPEPSAPVDLNKVVAYAADHLQRRGVQNLLVVHGDLPCLSADDLTAFLAAHRNHAVTIAPDRRRDGSNLLAWDLSTAFHASYGPGSFRRHGDEARRLGLSLNICAPEGAAWDIDTEDDLVQLSDRMRAFCGQHTLAFLEGQALKSRPPFKALDDRPASVY